jgi:hypothetical protein
LLLKKEILVPGRRWVIFLNYRISMLSMKYINMYARVMKSTSLHVICIKDIPCGVVSRRSIFSHIVRNNHLPVMCVRKFSSIPVPGSSIYAVIKGRSHLHVICLTKHL